MKRILTLACCMMMLTSTAHAQFDAVSLAKKRDASIDRGFLVPHAETLHEGELTLNSYELFFIGMSYGITDNIEASLTTLLPVFSNLPVAVAPQLKWALYRSDQQVLSARLNMTYLSDHENDASGGTFAGGISHDLYFDEQGRYAMHTGLDAGGVFGKVDEDWKMGDGAFFIMNVGLSAQVADYMKVMVEAAVPAIYADDQFEMSDIVNVTYGMRFFGDDLAADLGFLRPVGEDMSDSGLAMGFPYVAFTARL